MLSDTDLTARAVGGLWANAGGILQGHVIDLSPDAAGASEGAKKMSADKSRPAGAAPFSTFRSDPLPRVIRDINKQSDNMGARALLLSLSAGFPSKAATPASALLRLDQWLRTRGLPAGDVEIDNGSGLSRAEQARPRAMVQLLRQAWHDRNNARSFVNSLPIAGVDGTISNRMRDGPATGRAMLKTGSLLDVRSIAGYVKAANGRVYAVAAFVNHPDAPAATPVLDALVEWLAQLK